MDQYTSFVGLGKLFIEIPAKIYQTVKSDVRLEVLDKTKYVYDRNKLQQLYLNNNKGNNLRAKRLRVVVITEEEKQDVRNYLKKWHSYCQDELNQMEKLDVSDMNYERQVQYEERLEDTMSVIKGGMLWQNYEDFRVAAVIDDNGDIEAVCYSSDDKENIKAWHIDRLVSSPM